MATLAALLATLAAALLVVAPWHGTRVGSRPEWPTAGPVPARATVARHRYTPPPDPEWTLQRLAAGGW